MVRLEFNEQDGVLRVKGSKHQFFPADDSFTFFVSSLTYIGRVWTLDHIKVGSSDRPIEYHPDERLYGEAILQNATLNVIGIKSSGTSTVSMSVIPVAQSAGKQWSGQLRFIPDDSVWSLGVLVSEEAFAQVRKIYGMGRLERLTIRLQVQNAYEEGQGNCWLKPDDDWDAWSDVLVHDFEWHEVRDRLKTDFPDTN